MESLRKWWRATWRESAIIYILISIALAVTIYSLQDSVSHEIALNMEQAQLRKLSFSLGSTIIRLSKEARSYVQNLDEKHLIRYWHVLRADKTRDKLIEAIKKIQPSAKELEKIEEARLRSNALIRIETRAMRLAYESLRLPESMIPPEVTEFNLSGEEMEYSAADQRMFAQHLLFVPAYQAEVESATEPLIRFQKMVSRRIKREMEAAQERTALVILVLITLAVLIPILLTFDIAKRRRAEETLLRQSRIAELGARVGAALTQSETLQGMLQQCAEAMVHHLDVAFARIWTLNEKENVLELQSSAGMYTHIDGAHSRVPVGSYKIGLIAQERKPHLTNKVIGDPRVHDQAWAKREGMVSFAGYPLIVENRLVGVMAMFSREKLPSFTLEALASVANEIAIGIQRKHSEEALKKSEELGRSIIRTANDAFIAINAEGIIIDWNPQAEIIFGWKRHEVLGRVMGETIIPPGDREAHRKGLEYFLETGEGPILNRRIELTGLHRDGRTFPVELTVWPIRMGETYQFNAFVHDITERKQAEQKLKETNEEMLRHQERLMLALAELKQAHIDLGVAQSRLIQSEKLAMMGKLAGIISHEFRNELGVMRNAAYFLKMKLADADEKVKQHLGILEERIQDTDHIIENIMTFAKTQQPELKSTDLGRLVLATIEKIKAPGNIRIQTEIEKNLPLIQADEIQLDRVFINILLNAVQAMGEKEGWIKVQVSGFKNFVQISFEDNGPGVREEDKERMFEPLFSTKARGAGLGLATAKLLVEGHGGTIDIESKLGKGTQVIVQLPVR